MKSNLPSNDTVYIQTRLSIGVPASPVKRVIRYASIRRARFSKPGNAGSLRCRFLSHPCTRSPLPLVFLPFTPHLVYLRSVHLQLRCRRRWRTFSACCRRKILPIQCTPLGPQSVRRNVRSLWGRRACVYCFGCISHLFGDRDEAEAGAES